MKTYITITMTRRQATLVRDAIEFFAKDQLERGSNLPDPEMVKLNRDFNETRLQVAAELTELLKS